MAAGKLTGEIMLGKVRLYDYRCFRREAPATLEFHEGFTSFIGPNNSGKSALIRFPYELRNVIWTLTNSLRPSGLSSLHGPMGWNVSAGLYEPAEILCERQFPECSIEFEPSLQNSGENPAVGRLRIDFGDQATQFRCRFFDNKMQELPPSQQITELGENSLSISNQSYSLAPLRQFLELLQEVQYIGPFRNAINEGAGTHFDVHIGTSFLSQWNQWKTGPNRSQNRAIQVVTEDVLRLIGANSLEISTTADGKSLQVVVDRRPHKLQELGAGFSQMVVILANALIRKPSLIIIDEPELHLHPSLQAEFLTTLATYSRLGVMFATHSIGLARQAADRCFTVQKRGEGSSVRPYDRTPHLAEFLGSLGIAGLQELGWEKILLVEGVNDVRTAQALLRIYGKDQNVVILPLGGDSMANGDRAHELSEVTRLAGTGGRVFALVDSERGSADGQPLKVRREFADCCSGLGIHACVTQRRAIENYITQASIDQAFSPGRYTALGPYDKPGDKFCGKGEGWRAAKRMNRAELDETDIGQFFSSI